MSPAVGQSTPVETVLPRSAQGKVTPSRAEPQEHGGVPEGTPDHTFETA